MIVHANGKRLASRQLEGRRFTLRVTLPRGDVTVRVTTIARNGQRSSAHVHDVFGLPPGSRPRVVASCRDRGLERKLTTIVRDYPGTAGDYVQSLTGGSGAAWNARARFPAASTVKLAIAATVSPSTGHPAAGLAHRRPSPRDGHPVRRRGGELALVWLAGSTSSGAYRVNDSDAVDRLDRHADVRRLRDPNSRRRIPLRVDEAPAFGVGKYTTARDMTSLWRALWLASGGIGPLRSSSRADSRRCPVSPLAHRPRTRPAEARRDDPEPTARSTSFTRRAGLRGTPRYGPRLLGGRRLRRRRDDVPLVRRLEVLGSPRRARRRADAPAVPSRRRLIETHSTQPLP